MLYDNDKVNLLIGLLKAYDIRNAVLCPGSRNAMIVNNIVADGSDEHESVKSNLHVVNSKFLNSFSNMV